MSSARFASITSSLLARKGEAMPWNAALEGAAPPPQWRSAPQPVMPPPAPVLATSAMPPPPAGGKDKSCSLRMTAQDYERLGILSVKIGVSRQQLLQRALAQFLEREAQARACGCLQTGGCEKGCET